MDCWCTNSMPGASPGQTFFSQWIDIPAFATTMSTLGFSNAFLTKIFFDVPPTVVFCAGFGRRIWIRFTRSLHGVLRFHLFGIVLCMYVRSVGFFAPFQRMTWDRRTYGFGGG